MITTIVYSANGREFSVPVLTEKLFDAMGAYLDYPECTIVAVHVGR